MGCIKGVSYIYILEYIAENFGPGALEKVKATLSDEDRRLLFSTPIMPASWVDYPTYMRFYLQIDKVLGKGDFRLLEKVAAYGTQKMLRGIYKFFISLTSPKIILNNSHNVWRQCYDTGRVSVEWVGEKHCLVRLHEWPDIPKYHEYDIMESVRVAIRLSGGRNPSVVHPKCVARGAEECLFDEQWE